MSLALSLQARTVDADCVQQLVVPPMEGVIANERTGKNAASAAGKTLGSPSASKAAKRAAASALAQRPAARKSE